MTVNEQLVLLETRLAMVEKRLELVDAMLASSIGLNTIVKNLEETLNTLIFKNQEMMEALAKVKGGRPIDEEPRN